jgi:hypothetical protein
MAAPLVLHLRVVRFQTSSKSFRGKVWRFVPPQQAWLSPIFMTTFKQRSYEEENDFRMLGLGADVCHGLGTQSRVISVDKNSLDGIFDITGPICARATFH